MAPLYRWGSTALRLEPLRGGSLLFIEEEELLDKIDLKQAFFRYVCV